MSVESMWLRAHAPFQISFTHSAFLKGQGSNQFNSIQIYSQNGTRCTFRIFFLGGGWQAVSLGGGVTVREKRKFWQGG